MFEGILLMLAYYLIFPLGVLFLVFEIWKKRKYLHHSNKAKEKLSEEKRDKMKQHTSKKIRKYEISLVVFIILFMAIWSPLAMKCTDFGVHHEIRGGTSPKGAFYPVLDPVTNSIEPSWNTEKVKSEMEKIPEMWHPDLIKEHIDFDELTKFPGWLAVYRLKESRYIVTYTYYSPVPIIKAYGFIYSEDNDTNPMLILMEEETIIYPMSYDRAGSIVMD